MDELLDNPDPADPDCRAAAKSQLLRRDPQLQGSRQHYKDR